jgi:shikimate kinase
MVLATGGGVVLSPANREALSSRGLVIYLHTTIEQQLERTRYNKNRPLLDTHNRRARLESLMAQREPLYQEMADITIETDGGQARNLARRIARKLDNLTLT